MLIIFFQTLFCILAILLYIIKNIGLVFAHSIQCEKFYATIEDAETTCIQLLKNRNCPSKTIYFLASLALQITADIKTHHFPAYLTFTTQVTLGTIPFGKSKTKRITKRCILIGYEYELGHRKEFHLSSFVALGGIFCSYRKFNKLRLHGSVIV